MVHIVCTVTMLWIFFYLLYGFFFFCMIIILIINFLICGMHFYDFFVSYWLGDYLLRHFMVFVILYTPFDMRNDYFD